MSATGRSGPARWIAAGLAAAMAAGLYAAAPAAAQEPEFSAERLGDSLLVVSGPDGNVVVAEEADGLTLIGGASEANAEALLAFLEGETGGAQVARFVMTDWKPARSGLNLSLGDGAEIVAHANAVQWLKYGNHDRADGVVYAPMDPAGLPDTTFYDSGMALAFGEGEIDLGFLQQAHCDSDIYAYFPGADVLVAGPAVRSDGWIMFDWWAGAYLGSLLEAYDELLEVAGEDTVIVPSSGPLMTRADLQAQADMYAEMFERVSGLVLSSMSPEEAAVAAPTGEYHPEWADADEFVVRAHNSFRTHMRRDPRLGPIP